MLRAFLSHSTKDIALAKAIRDYCAKMNIALYLYEDDPQPGRHLSDKLISRIKQSQVLIALLTPAAVASPTVQAEVGAAMSHGIPVIPLVQKGVDTEKLVFLQGREWITFDPADQESGYRQMMTYFTRLSRKYQSQVAAAAEAQARAQATNQTLLALGLMILAGVALYYLSKE